MTCCAGAEDILKISSHDVHLCLQHEAPINVTAFRVLINYTYPGPSLPLSNNGHHHVCWVQVNSPSPDTDLEVEWLTQTCDLANYVTVHGFRFNYGLWYMVPSWRSLKWTGCESREDPMSAYYKPNVDTVYVGLHVQNAHTPYNVTLAIKTIPRPYLQHSSDHKHLEIVLTSLYSGELRI